MHWNHILWFWAKPTIADGVHTDQAGRRPRQCWRACVTRLVHPEQQSLCPQVDAVVEAARSALSSQAARQASSLLDSLPPDLWARLQDRLRTSVASAEKVCRPLAMTLLERACLWAVEGQARCMLCSGREALRAGWTTESFSRLHWPWQ